MGLRQRVTVAQRARRASRILAMALTGACLLAQPTYATATSAADRAATHTFLEATYTLDLTVARNTAKVEAAVNSAGEVIAAECPKVLAGAPGGPSGSSTEGTANLSPRARGEADRQQRQYQELVGELDAATHSAALQVDKQALDTFVASVTPLRWSNPVIAPAVQFEVSLVRAFFESGPAPAVCADMRSWVSSGYRTLSTGTRSYETREESLIESPPPQISSEALLEPYEGPSERAILQHREALPESDVLDLDNPARHKLHRQLGIEEDDSGTTSILTKSKTFAHGRTHTGINYKVEVDRGFSPGCKHIISFGVTLPSGDGTSITSSSAGSLRCLSGTRPAANAQVTCEEGRLQIESSTLAQTRRVRLTLSNGRTLVSPVTLVPRKYGGPAGVYFQTLRGPSPYPVSLSELDAHDRLTRTVALRAAKGCHVAALSKPAFRRIVNEKTPSGQSFFIVGFSEDDHGHHSLNLDAEGSPFLPNTSESSALETPPTAQAKPFPWKLAVDCEPHPYALIYGRLSKPGETVLAATAATPLEPLLQVKIPVALHAPGKLAYRLLTALPTELVVESATGATLVKEDLTARAKSATEYCEGYVEG